jgi:hypothetical protein
VTSTQKRCDDCRHLRRFRPISQLLAQDLGTAEQGLVSELLKIMQEERQQRDSEAELKAKLFENRDMRWPYRPHISDYCGRNEENGEYLVHELKNRDGSCDDWQRGTLVPRRCGDCQHQRLGGGSARDVRTLAELAQISASSAVLGLGAKDETSNYIELVGTRKAFEAAQAFYAGRVTGNPPEYLSNCVRYSTPGNNIPCVVQNPNASCVGWSGKTQSIAAPAPAPAPTSAPAPAATSSPVPARPSLFDGLKRPVGRSSKA